MGTGSDVIVVGGGIAGLTAALFAARSGLDVSVLTGDQLGGQLLNISRIEDFPGFPEGVAGYELCPMVQEQAGTAGAEFAFDSARSLSSIGTRWSVQAQDTGEWNAAALIVATGAEILDLGVPGEERLRGRGVSTCASCDGPLHSGGTVAVVGGGDSALLEALELAEHAEKVYLIHNDKALAGQRCYKQRVEDHHAIEVLAGRVVTEIGGDETVSEIVVSDAVGGSVEHLAVTGVFPYIGLRPRTEILRSLVDLDSFDRAIVDSEMRSSARGVFVAGESRSGFSGQAASAAGDGAAAAMAAARYIDGSVPWPS